MITKIKSASARLKHFKLKLILAVVLLTCCLASTVLAASNAVTTFVYCEGKMSKVVSFTTEPEEIIKKAQIDLQKEDKISLDHYQQGTDENVIYVYKAHHITIHDDDKRIPLTVAGCVSDALNKAGLKLALGDKININSMVFLTEGMDIVIKRAFGVTVIADDDSQSFHLTKGTVADALEKAKVTLGKYDTVSYDMEKLLKEGMKIVVKRIRYEIREQTEAIPFSSVTEYDSSMYTDEQKITTQGADGQKKTVYIDKYVDGKRTSSKVKSVKTIKQPITQVKAVGTRYRLSPSARPASSSGTISVLSPGYNIELDENGRPVHYRNVITGKATAYCTGTITSTGVPPIPGRVAVDPSEIPYGTKMYIVSSDGNYVYGYAVAADTGGFTWNGSGTLIDLYMNTYSECVNFGRRTVEVYIL